MQSRDEAKECVNIWCHCLICIQILVNANCFIPENESFGLIVIKILSVALTVTGLLSVCKMKIVSFRMI